MLRKYTQAIASHKVLIQNFSYLSALQAFNMLIPLLTYPYLIRVLGKETYGLVVFAQAIIGYFVILVSFGFNISATKEISSHRDNKEKLSEIVSSVLIIKGVLFIIALIILSITLFFIPQATGYKSLFFLTMWLCLYDVIFPQWYFQGIEQMKYITYISMVSRITFLGLIFVFIRSSSDYLLIPIINGIGALLAGTTSLYIIFLKHKIEFRTQPIAQLKFYLKDSAPIFLSIVSSKVYVSSNKIIVGTFLSMTDVAYYDLAEKLFIILKMPISILSQSLFPKISKEKNIQFVKKIFNISVLGSFIIVLVFILCSKYIILFLGGENMLNTILIANILAAILPIITMSHFWGNLLLIPFGYYSIYSKIIVTSGFIYFFISLFIGLVLGFSIINVTLMAIIPEIFGASTMFYFCKKYNLWPKTKNAFKYN